MPVALLLHTVTSSLTWTAVALSPWVEIVALESTLVERARSAFLVHWFGRRLPFTGLSLRATIANMGELDAQFGVAQRSVPVSRGGPTLAPQLAGLTGMLAGIVLTPVGGLMTARELLHVVGVSFSTVVKAIGLVVAPWLLATATVLAPRQTLTVLGAGLPAAALGYGMAAALGDRQDLRALFGLMGGLGRFAVATPVLVDQVRGDRADVPNRMLRQLLGVGDRLAALFAQVLGAVALLVDRIGPRLPSAAAMLVGIAGLAAAVGDVLSDVLSGLTAGLAPLVGGPGSVAEVVERAAGSARRGLATVRSVATTQLDVLAATFTALGTALDKAFGDFKVSAGEFVAGLFTTHPVVQVITALRTQVRIAGTAQPDPAATHSSLLDAFTPPELPKLRAFPALPTLPDGEALERQLRVTRETPLRPVSLDEMGKLATELAGSGEIRPVAPSPAALDAISRAGARPSVLLPEWRAAAAQFGPLPAALVVNELGLARFREAMSVVVGRVLPPARRVDAVRQLVGVLDGVDATLYGQAERPAAEPVPLPVLEVAPEDLRADVRALRLRVPSSAVPVDRFEALLRTRLLGALTAPAPVPVGSER